MAAALPGQLPSSPQLLVVPQAELARLRTEAATRSTTNVDARLLLDARTRHERRLQLKQKSDERVSRWSDTIEVCACVCLVMCVCLKQSTDHMRPPPCSTTPPHATTHD